MTDTATILAPTDVRRGSVVTGEMLKDWGACGNQADRVDELWPEGFVVTLENLVQAATEELDVEWFAQAILRAAAWAEYKKVTAAAWAEYKKVRAAAWAEYEKVTAAARAEYEKVTAAARAEYEKVTAAARAEYEKVTAAARAEYEKVTAAALWALIAKATT